MLHVHSTGHRREFVYRGPDTVQAWDAFHQGAALAEAASRTSGRRERCILRDEESGAVINVYVYYQGRRVA